MVRTQAVAEPHITPATADAAGVPAFNDRDYATNPAPDRRATPECCCAPSCRAAPCFSVVVFRGSEELSGPTGRRRADRKSTRLNSSHLGISYAVFCLKKKK